MGGNCIKLGQNLVTAYANYLPSQGVGAGMQWEVFSVKLRSSEFKSWQHILKILISYKNLKNNYSLLGLEYATQTDKLVAVFSTNLLLAGFLGI